MRAFFMIMIVSAVAVAVVADETITPDIGDEDRESLGTYYNNGVVGGELHKHLTPNIGDSDRVRTGVRRNRGHGGRETNPLLADKISHRSSDKSVPRILRNRGVGGRHLRNPTVHQYGYGAYSGAENANVISSRGRLSSESIWAAMDKSFEERMTSWRARNNKGPLPRKRSARVIETAEYCASQGLLGDFLREDHCFNPMQYVACHPLLADESDVLVKKCMKRRAAIARQCVEVAEACEY